MKVPRVVIGIDPGQCTGVAVGLDGRLVQCYAATPDDPLRPFPDEVARLLASPLTTDRRILAKVELPKFYPPQSYGSPAKAYGVGNALIRESVTLGRWVERATQAGATVVEVVPRDWKGTAPKLAFCRRVVRLMSREERALVVALKLPKSKVHNVIDGVGLMFSTVGRL